MQTNKSDGAKMIRKMIVDIAKSQSMDQCKNQNKVRVNIYIYVWCIYIYNEYGDVAVLGTEHMTWNFKTDRSPVDPSNIRDFRPFPFFSTSWNIFSLTFRLEFTEKKGANRIKIGPQLKKLF